MQVYGDWQCEPSGFELPQQQFRTEAIRYGKKTKAQLNSTYKELNRVDIAADVIRLIRQQPIESALICHEKRISGRLNDSNKTIVFPDGTQEDIIQ